MVNTRGSIKFDLITKKCVFFTKRLTPFNDLYTLK